jgi:hypothetical protein
MKTTLMADKKLASFFTQTNESKLEMKIRSVLIYEGLNECNGFISCQAEDIWTIAHRAWFYGISIIGVESNIDEDVPFYDFCIEDYVDEVRNYGEDNPTYWILTALMPVVNKHPGIQLKFYIDIPDMNIPVLAKSTGIAFEAQ